MLHNHDRSQHLVPGVPGPLSPATSPSALPAEWRTKKACKAHAVRRGIWVPTCQGCRRLRQRGCTGGPQDTICSAPVSSSETSPTLFSQLRPSRSLDERTGFFFNIPYETEADSQDSSLSYSVSGSNSLPSSSFFPNVLWMPAVADLGHGDTKHFFKNMVCALQVKISSLEHILASNNRCKNTVHFFTVFTQHSC